MGGQLQRELPDEELLEFVGRSISAKDKPTPISGWEVDVEHLDGRAGWDADYKAWSQRDLSQKRYVYWWADGVYFNVRLDEERSCVLVLIGATEDGSKELLAVVDGYRESTQSWRELLGQLTRLGRTTAPKLALGDGSLSLLDRAAGRIWPSSPAAVLGTQNSKYPG